MRCVSSAQSSVSRRDRKVQERIRAQRAKAEQRRAAGEQSSATAEVHHFAPLPDDAWRLPRGDSTHGNSTQGGDQQQTGAYDVIFSQRTANVPFVEELIARLAGKRCFYQKNIKIHMPEHWRSQWMKAEASAKKGVCVLSCAYLKSKACCDEWNVLGSKKRIEKNIVVEKKNMALHLL